MPLNENELNLKTFFRHTNSLRYQNRKHATNFGQCEEQDIPTLYKSAELHLVQPVSSVLQKVAINYWAVRPVFKLTVLCIQKTGRFARL